MLCLIPNLREILEPFDQENDHSPTSAEKKTLFEMLLLIFENKSPYVVYKLTFAPGMEPRYILSSDMVVGFAEAGDILASCPQTFNLTDFDDYCDDHLLFNMLTPTGVRVYDHTPPQGNQFDQVVTGINDLTLGAPVSFEENLQASPLFTSMAQNIKFMVEQMQAAATAAPPLAVSSVSPPIGSSSAGVPDYMVVYPQSENAQTRTDIIIGTKGTYHPRLLYTDLYGTGKIPNQTNAYEGVGQRFASVFQHPDKPLAALRRPFLLFVFQNSECHGHDLFLTSMCTRKCTFDSEATFFNCRYSLSAYAQVVFGVILATAIRTLFDSVYCIMIDYRTLSWNFIEDYILLRLNRTRALRTLNVDLPSFDLAATLAGYMATDRKEIDYFLVAVSSVARLICTPCGRQQQHQPPTRGAAKDSPESQQAGGRHLKDPRPTEEGRNPNHDWNRAPSPPDCSIAMARDHPCYFWAHQNPAFPCPNDAAGVQCPRPHCWPGRMTLKHKGVQKFLTWLRKDKLLS